MKVSQTEKRAGGRSEEVLATWSRTSRRIAEAVRQRYDNPHEVTNQRLIWHFNSPWLRTIVHREGTLHNFPMRHFDHIEQTISYRVPPNKVGELDQFNGSLLVDRTRGELTAYCGTEELNLLLLNLAHDIVVESKTVAEARRAAVRSAHRMRLKWPDPYTDQLNFAAPWHAVDEGAPAGDPDSKRVRA